METFLDLLTQQEMTTQSTLIDGLLAVLLSFILALIITQVYKRTYNGRQYSQSFVHTVIIMGVVVSVIMIVIGNNIAVAFGLVGAFSIIRFRSAMSDPKDIAFIFFAMAAGIACGLGFYLLAIAFTLTLSALIVLLFVFDYGKDEKGQHRTLKVTIPENLQYEGVFDDIFEQFTDENQLKRVQTTNLGTMIELEYDIIVKTGLKDKDLMDSIRERNANLKISINYAPQTND
ncbi:DUF4956 domain-containing protein [Halalkalibacter sp. APA_J-10(15)]|uniref:DUF4956 domain-containing protein n=1 Tax=unclassified Halalkalibacter TaxID=2893063 RepID=UPI001FF52978|nr:DUF4956 domain-containing protein [Halalkalibacter sp. APA_J-10(15)]MCK0470298.1 DUF4956 domain-containing protein [Halalkalibacter sp. APA_J-10(15)]